MFMMNIHVQHVHTIYVMSLLRAAGAGYEIAIRLIFDDRSTALKGQ